MRAAIVAGIACVGAGQLDNRWAMNGEPQKTPRPIDAQPTIIDTVLATERCAPIRAMGQPSSPESVAIPSVDPNPKSAIYASLAAVVGSVVSTSAVNAPLPANPCTAPMSSGRRASVQRPMWTWAGTPG